MYGSVVTLIVPERDGLSQILQTGRFTKKGISIFWMVLSSAIRKSGKERT